jgi:SAM-dependent methyltransferase
MDIRAYNRNAWNHYVKSGNRWTIPVSPQEIAEAKKGKWEIYLTPTKAVPQEWFPKVAGSDVLCLASGGGQQGPLMSAVGAQVTVLDNSPSQLQQDQYVANRENLPLKTVEGDMADLNMFSDHSFDLIINPVSNVFAPSLHPIWKEAFRVLRPGGVLLAGFMNPVLYLFDDERFKKSGEFEVVYSIPYSDLSSPDAEARQRLIREGQALEFSHTLEDQIGGQLKAGFVLTGFYEDSDPEIPLSKYIPVFIATRAMKYDLRINLK